MAKAAAAAKKASLNITSRHSSSFGRRVLAASLEDPDDAETMEASGEEDEFQLWKLLPQLKDLPESMLRKLPLTAMFQLNAALQKEKKCSEKLGVNSRLAQNAKRQPETQQWLVRDWTTGGIFFTLQDTLGVLAALWWSNGLLLEQQSVRQACWHWAITTWMRLDAVAA